MYETVWVAMIALQRTVPDILSPVIKKPAAEPFEFGRLTPATTIASTVKFALLLETPQQAQLSPAQPNVSSSSQRSSV